ncbi:MAG: aminoglycoside phosphotransferase family protein [Myxococcota bacterium]
MVEAGLPPSGEALSAALSRLVGAEVDPACIEAEWREWRWMARVPPYQLFLADSAAAWAKLELEADLLDAAGRTLGSRVPLVVAHDPAARVQVRDWKTGVHGWEIEDRIFGVKAEPPPLSLPRYSMDCPLTEWGEVFAAELGQVLARLHRGTTTEGLLSRVPPQAIDWEPIASTVQRHTDSALLLRACGRVKAWDEARDRGATVLHGDPHLHNVFADEAGRVTALIDFDEACVGDRHEDLMYLQSQGPRFAEFAMAAYERESGVDVDRDMVRRMHVRSAFQHLGWVDPDAPRFPRIVAWATEAVEVLTPEWG